MKKQGQTAYNMECPEFESRPSSQYGKINCMEKPDKILIKKERKNNKIKKFTLVLKLACNFKPWD